MALPELLETGGAGGLGGVIGALFSFLGLKSKIDSTDKRIDKVIEGVVFTSTCNATHKGIEKRMDDQGDTLVDMGKDIKDILKEMRK